MKATAITAAGSVATSVSNKGFVTNNVLSLEYPKDHGFLTYVDSTGSHLLYHGKCGGRPQFLTDALILEPGCEHPLIFDVHGQLVKEVGAKGSFSYAGQRKTEPDSLYR